eukprot:14194870-Ditylum_brightwellii.AAC.1
MVVSENTVFKGEKEEILQQYRDGNKGTSALCQTGDKGNMYWKNCLKFNLVWIILKQPPIH